MPGSGSEKSDTRDSTPAVDKESAAYLKRREQVRRAQRTHRERKENYIKALEDEVHQLRTNERKIMQQNEALATEVAELKKMRASGITSAAHSDCSTSTSVSLGDGSWLHPDLGYPTLDVDRYSYAGSESLPSWPLLSLSGEGSDGSRMGSAAGSIADSESYALVPHATRPGSSSNPTSTDFTANSRRPTPKLLCDTNQTDIAMEFILTLEKPCFNRASSVVFDMGHPSDMTVSVPSSNLTYHSYLEETFCPSTPGSSSGLSHGRRDTELSTSQSLDKLLALSPKFGLTTEVTPIQAWQQIVSHPKFGSLGTETLWRLVDEMLEHIRCYGFGAVIETTVFRLLFSNVIG